MSAPPLDPSHPNLHLGRGTGKRNQPLRDRLLLLLALDPPLSFAEIAEELGVTRERVRKLAKEAGVQGRLKIVVSVADDKGETVKVRVGVLRGRRRWFRKGASDNNRKEKSND